MVLPLISLFNEMSGGSANFSLLPYLVDGMVAYQHSTDIGVYGLDIEVHPQISKMKNKETVDKAKHEILCFNVFDHGCVGQMYVGHIPISQKAWNSFFCLNW
jgi:hypothetical protein